jgi:hypothetical protein
MESNRLYKEYSNLKSSRNESELLELIQKQELILLKYQKQKEEFKLILANVPEFVFEMNY